MSNNALSNVLPFGERFTPRGADPSADAAKLLPACRDRLVHAIATAFAERLSGAGADLLVMADRATSMEHQQLYFVAMDLLAKRGQELLQQFRSAYVAQFDAGVTALRQGRDLDSLPELGELELIDTDAYERDLAIRKLSARAACNCSQQLTALERRLAALLRLQRIGQEDNPLFPQALFTSMLQACREMDLGEQLPLVLLSQFERQTAAELPKIYNELNRFLSDNAVLPAIPVGLLGPSAGGAAYEVLQDSARPSVRDPGSQVAASGAGAPMPAGGGPQGGIPGGDDVFGQIARALGAVSARGPASAPAPAYGPAQGHPGVPASLGVAQLVEALSSVQRGLVDTRQLPGLGSVQIDPAGSQVLQQLRATPMVSWSHPVDALTIDIVAMLFDVIFNDPDLPAVLRAEIARLQIPVLKVALMDKGFFSNKRHPARRLLDAIAVSGIGRSEKDERRLVAEIKSIVDEVVEGFETDIGIFAVQLERLERFLQQEEEHAKSVATEVVGRLERRDREALAHTRVRPEVERRVNRRRVPNLVADFLNRHWRLVMVRIFLDSGDTGQEWEDAVRAMDDLLWSVEPKQAAEDRRRFLGALPDLLKRLRAGLQAVDMEDAWDPFFSQLIRLHVGAIQREAVSDLPRFEPVSHSSSSSHSSSTTDTTVGRDSGSQDLSPGSAAPTSDDVTAPGPAAVGEAEVSGDPYLRLAQSLEVGAWVELESQRGTRKTLRLNWVSEFRGVYLFTNRQGENALTLAASSLADHLRKGTARVLSHDRLTDRAVAQLLERAKYDAVAQPAGA